MNNFETWVVVGKTFIITIKLSLVSGIQIFLQIESSGNLSENVHFRRMNIAVLIPTVISFVIDMYMKQCLYFHQVGARTLYACAEKKQNPNKIGQFSDYKP